MIVHQECASAGMAATNAATTSNAGRISEAAFAYVPSLTARLVRVPQYLQT